ncbi:EfeM/EfeO family lipoprotein [Patulibacter minatonensis]|uniref:EfeM/EfeO family lipoprotein n=1 Tax=Patulibacter minatonensis TaxID=298163 RepID=UPI0006851522|nr:EfeM/EfeO family lipoprotein [Patulibacter minatonensis]
MLDRLSRGALLGAVLLIAVVVGLVLFTALGVGGGPADHPERRAAVPGRTVPHPAALPGRAGRSESIGSRENGDGGDPDAPVLNEAIPFREADFRGPIARYRRYAAAEVDRLIPEAATLRRAVASGDRERSRTAWRAAFERYQRLGAVYGAFGEVDGAIDGLAGGLPHGTRDRHFTGLHRLELGLWGHEPVRSLIPVATRLTADVRRLRRVVPRTEITALDFATRAHEIVEDAQRDFLSGRHVPWSHEGVLATAGGLDATQAVLTALHPLLKGQQSEVTSQAGLDRLRGTLRSIRAAHHGVDPTTDALRPSERNALNASTSWALERLQTLPGSLETTDPPPIPKLPSR